MDHSRDPCPWVALSDFGGAFSMGAIGGSVWHGIKGFRNSPYGERRIGMITAIKARAPVTGGNFGVWGGMFSTYDCAVKGIRKKEDPYNSIIAGFLTGGSLAVRGGWKAARNGAIMCGIFLAVIEGVGIGIQRMMAEQTRLDALRSLPPSIVEDLLPEEPRDSYRNVWNERDRRLRQVLRRYENQILYGCHNRRCIAPSCLSYRKRNSKTPLRPHTETSARALAGHLVEECARSRKDPVDGLCLNRPVVPWYQDPRTTHARRKTKSDPEHTVRSPVPNGHIKTPSEQRFSGQASDDAQPNGRRQHAQPPVDITAKVVRDRPANVRDRSAARRKSDTIEADEFVEGGQTQRPRRDSGDRTSPRESQDDQTIVDHAIHVEGVVRYLVTASDGSSPVARWRVEDDIVDKSMLARYKTKHGISNDAPQTQESSSNSAADSVDDRDTASHDHRSASQLSNDKVSGGGNKKLDFASFTQRLWNTLSLTNLELEPASDAYAEQREKHPEHDHQHHASLVEHDTMSGGSTPPADRTIYTNTALCGFTLRRLSLQNMHWLFTSLTAELDCVPVLPRPLLRFVMQSVQYVFGDPSRLLESARTWNDGSKLMQLSSVFDSCNRQPARSYPPRTRSHKVTHGTDSDEVDPKSTKSQVYVDEFCSGALAANLAPLSRVPGGTDLLYGPLHDMLQQCYSISHPGYHGEQAAKSQRKMLKRSGGGLVDHSIRNAEETGLIRTPANVLDHKQISRLLAITFLALVSPAFTAEKWNDSNTVVLLAMARWKNDNVTSLNFTNSRDSDSVIFARAVVDGFDQTHNWYRRRLCAAVTDCISHHLAAANIGMHKSSLRSKPSNIIDRIIELLFANVCGGLDNDEHIYNVVRYAFVDGLIDIARTVLLSDWDREPIVTRTGAVGGALELLSSLYNHPDLVEVGFWPMAFVRDALDEMEEPVRWLTFEPTGRITHILSYPFLFEDNTLVKYFRTINASTMRTSFDQASMVYTDALHYLHTNPIPVYSGEDVLSSLRPFMAKYFVLTIRRDDILGSALDQLWRRQKREVLRPLRVRLGREGGEDGLDHGGVQQEFFRLAFAEAFKPDYGMFSVDQSTHMTWFQPGSLEPSWKFEAIGILMSLALYNAITLPITMPLAFYRKILGLKVTKLEHIEDGWPVLAKGLRYLLEYDGNVAEDIGRTYEFSYDFGGAVYTIDMRKKAAAGRRLVPSKKGKERATSPCSSPQPSADTPRKEKKPLATATAPADTAVPLISGADNGPGPAAPSPPSSADSSPPRASSPLRPRQEPPLVTNATRQSFVTAYIAHLTNTTIEPQFSAFVKGLHTCFPPKALTLFTPQQLRDLVEGHRVVTTQDLRSIATYDSYDPEEGYIRAFWLVVEQETAKDPEFAKALLEFVTASERLPAGGLQLGSFVIQKNGDSIVHAPTEDFSDMAGLVGRPELIEREKERKRRGDKDEQGGWKARLPSSSTCYGRFLLPRYRVAGEREGMPPEPNEGREGREGSLTWVEVLRERLVKAVMEGRGFGML
ncbi:Mitochondrial import inner membrane translocase subunit tim17 [Cyphellophora attinorum]|uniref:HECT-type E3 ubiquitin transferase n=1 Tax=Cyphellophora attinorum TaxID=1664694 RepID=A0A0N1P087_9EURO|nr:Mitochondrial import inner membrane translocase subunit tim17 [Phialophora attinorum]KPI39857.1 Mitochondrial import inner membrane translocase subunit tim17 [Phialophora attinorum]